MDRIFKFGPAVLAVPAARIGVFLVGELGSVLVKGELFMQLCPLIDGRRSVGDLVQALQGSLSVAEVLYGVDWLAGQGHLIPVALSPLPGRAWTVEVVAPGQADPTPFARKCSRGIPAASRRVPIKPNLSQPEQCCGEVAQPVGAAASGLGIKLGGVVLAMNAVTASCMNFHRSTPWRRQDSCAVNPRARN